MKLESIVPASRLSAIAGDVVVTRPYGPDAVEVTWRGPNGLGDRIFYREDKPWIREVSPGRRWPFDGDEDGFRLPSEALRIRLTQLFDTYVNVNSSHIEPLPHQLTADYGVMLGRQPLCFLLADNPGTGQLPEIDRLR